MSWQDRVRDNIKLTSPSGEVFNAKWKGDTIDHEKKVAEFDFPDFHGTVAQDLGTKSRRFPLTFYFDGENHDKDAKKFDDALKQTGRWDVIHPVYGPLELQPLSISILADPTESGNVTEINSRWMEPADDFVIQSTTELQSSTSQQANDTMNTSADQADANTVQDTAKQTANTKSAAERTLGAVQNTTKDLVRKSTDLANKINTTIRSIQETIDNTIIPMIELAGQIKELILLPEQISQDFTSRIEKYKELFSEILGIEPTGTTKADKNTVAIQEHVLTGVISATALICVNSDYDTKQQSIEAAETLIDLFNQMLNQLDTTQGAFKNNDIDFQYFSQSLTFTQLYNLVATALKYLIASSFNLSIEKIIKLTKPTIPAEIVIREYGELGENDILLDIFIAINKLKKDEILLMPIGKEVTVYV